MLHRRPEPTRSQAQLEGPSAPGETNLLLNQCSTTRHYADDLSVAPLDLLHRPLGMRACPSVCSASSAARTPPRSHAYRSSAPS
jgi:hypothetical protein